MTTIGIICEYNPFHNGHIYHIKKIKELFEDSMIILVMSGNFVQRGDISVINKWDKTMIALKYGIDLVVELPFVFATQSADIFAHGAVQILNELNVDKIVFGSECNDIDKLKILAEAQLSNNYQQIVKSYINDGNNYPTSMAKALNDITGINIKDPNDILGVCYIKEIIDLNSNIEPIAIKRTTDYNSVDTVGEISSATSIRNCLKNNLDISKFVPCDSLNYINKCFIDDYYKLIKYKVITTDIEKYVTVDEGIKYRILKYIDDCKSLEELINKIKTKRYTYNRLKRMFLHILCDFTKDENELCKDIHYIRVLGFNDIGKNYLNRIKKKTTVPVISNFSNIKDIILDIELKTTKVYSMNFLDDSDIIKSEYKNIPIMEDKNGHRD